MGIRRSLAPYGVRDLLTQIGLWVVFGLAYEAVRGAALHSRARAFRDGHEIIHLEQRVHGFFEVALQNALPSGRTIDRIFTATYWISEFVLLVLALVYAYFRRRPTYARFRDAVLLSNSLGLFGYLFFPTAPPRLFAGYGFRNGLSGQPMPDHATGWIAFAANPYAAMPSLHIADAVLIGVFLASLSRSWPAKLAWSLWPCWLAYVVMATGNHFWLDVVAGAALAGLSLLVVSFVRRARQQELALAAAPVEHAGSASRSDAGLRRRPSRSAPTTPRPRRRAVGGSAGLRRSEVRAGAAGEERDQPDQRGDDRDDEEPLDHEAEHDPGDHDQGEDDEYRQHLR